jgi:hypothetical protein
MRKYLIIIFVYAVAMTFQSEAAPTKAKSNSFKREVAGALLETAIRAQAINSSKDNQGRIQPGSEVKLSVVINNVGDVPSAPGKVQLRYSFPKQMFREAGSVIFETEFENLPSIPPGGVMTVNFQKNHQWPSLFDYIRNDWAMREYQAILAINGEKFIAATRAVSFSAYYYVGQEEKGPVRVSSADYSKEPVIKSKTAIR